MQGYENKSYYQLNLSFKKYGNTSNYGYIFLLKNGSSYPSYSLTFRENGQIMLNAHNSSGDRNELQSYSWSDYSWHNLSIEVRGESMDIYLDQNSTPIIWWRGIKQIERGTIGFKGVLENINFDNIILTQLDILEIIPLNKPINYIYCKSKN